MSTDASFEVTYAVINALRANADLAAYVGTRIYDEAPQNTTLALPNITFGPSDTHRADVTCVSAREVYLQIDIWSGANSSAECKQICGIVEDALHHVSLTLLSNRLVSLEHRMTQVFMDADGVTHHGVVQIVAYVDVT